ncbi:hypothetical protein P8452_47092 [Trifolium repens]|nr:hypothetical protein P8452_47092 [Trifolium repens]
MQGPNKINVPNESVNSIIIANQNSQNIPIKTCPNPVGQLSNTKEPQSLPNNTLNVSIPIVTGGTASVIKPAVNQHLFPPIATFNASAKSTYQPSTSTTKHVRPATSHVKRVSSSVQSLANHFQTLSQPLHVSQPIMTPIIFTDPTHKNKYSLPNHTMPTQPSCRKLIDHELPSMQAIPAPQIPIVTPENNVSVPFPVTVTDDSEGVENMEVQVERKRRREEEIKKCSTNVSRVFKARWKIGDGRKIKIMDEPWLRGDDNLWMQSPQNQTPPKTKHLLWRVCRGCLPTRVRLRGRSESVETIGHFAMVIWCIWNNRNNWVWNGVKDSAKEVAHRASHMIGEWRTVKLVQRNTAGSGVHNDRRVTAAANNDMRVAAAAEHNSSRDRYPSQLLRWQKPRDGDESVGSVSSSDVNGWIALWDDIILSKYEISIC